MRTALHVDARPAAPSFAEWLLRAPEFPHVHPADVQSHLRRLDTVAADLLARRGEPRTAAEITSLDPADVAHVVAGARARAELLGQDRLTVVREWCWSWHAYLGFLAATDRWAGTLPDLAVVRSALVEEATRTRGGLLAGAACTDSVAPVTELRRLRRTRLVQDAEDVLRRRAPGAPELRAALVHLGYLSMAGGRGPHRGTWDSPSATEAARARRRLVTAGVVRVLAQDAPAAVVIAQATSAHPADVAAGTRQLGRLVTDGRLADLVAAGVLPDAAPWRISQALQPAVHVALTRLDDDGVLADLLVGPSERPVQAPPVRAG